jgi:hypothetical protein
MRPFPAQYSAAAGLIFDSFDGTKWIASTTEDRKASSAVALFDCFFGLRSNFAKMSGCEAGADRQGVK